MSSGFEFDRDEIHAHDDGNGLAEVDTEAPRSLRGGRPNLLAFGVGGAVALLAGLVVFGLFGIFHKGPPHKTAEQSYESSAASPAITPQPAFPFGGRPTNGCVLTGRGYVCPPRTTVTIAPSIAPSCPPTYHLVAPPGYAPQCVPNATPPATGTTRAVAAATPLPTLPPQTLSLESPGADETQAVNDIQQRGGSVNQTPTATTGNAGGSSYAPPGALPVYQNGRIVAYTMGSGSQSDTGETSFISAQQDTTSTYGSAQSAQGAGGSEPTAGAAQQNEQDYGNLNTRHAGYVPILTSDQLDRFTTITASLYSQVNSELPGPFKAITIGPTSCSLGNYRAECVPDGTWVYGEYDTRLVNGQARLLAAVESMRFPNGCEFNFPGSVADATGGAGMYGDTDKHYGAVFGAAALMAVLGAASAALAPSSYSIYSGPSIGSTIASSVGAQIAQVGNQIIGSRVNRPPTIIIDPTRRDRDGHLMPYIMQIWVLRDLPLYRYAITKDCGK